MDFSEKISKIDWRHIAILAFIFLLAFGIRGYLFKYDLMFEFDTYWHTRMTAEIIQNGVPPAIDPLAYYQLPDGSPIPQGTMLFWYLGSFIYSIAALLTGTVGYNKELLIQVVKFVPAFFGAITALLLYFLGKEAYGRRAGYAMAFFGAVSASFIYRTMAGFYEAGGLGHIWLVLGLIFLVRMTKNVENRMQFALNILLAGISFGLLAFTYGVFQVVPLLFGFFFIMTGIEFLHKRNLQSAALFGIGTIAVFAIFFGFTVLSGNANWLSDFGYLVEHSLSRIFGSNAANLLLPALFGVALVVIAVLLFFSFQKEKETKPKQEEKTLAWIKVVLLYLILIGAVWLALSPKNVTGIIAQSVGEESAGYRYFAHKFNVLILLPILMLIIAPFIEFKKKEIDPAGMLLFGFVLLFLYMAWDRLHYSYNFGVPLAIAAGYVFHYGLKFFEKRDRFEKQLIGIGLLFMVFAGVASATLFTQQNIPTIEENTGWKEGLAWLSKNTPQDAKMFNWWDEGHWITFWGERSVITDNRNYDQKANSDVGKFSTTTDVNEALGILTKYNSDYLLLGGDLFAKRNSMILYGYYLESEPNQADPRFDQVQSFSAPCSQSDENGTTWISCASLRVPKAPFESIPATWTDKPFDVENQRNPYFLYRSTDNARLYKFSAKVNASVFARIWMHDPQMAQYFEEVYPANVPGAVEKEFKVFRIKKENLPKN